MRPEVARHLQRPGHRHADQGRGQAHFRVQSAPWGACAGVTSHQQYAVAGQQAGVTCRLKRTTHDTPGRPAAEEDELQESITPTRLGSIPYPAPAPSPPSTAPGAKTVWAAAPELDESDLDELLRQAAEVGECK